MIQFLHCEIHHVPSSFLVKIIISKTKRQNFLSNLVFFMIIWRGKKDIEKHIMTGNHSQTHKLFQCLPCSASLYSICLGNINRVWLQKCVVLVQWRKNHRDNWKIKLCVCVRVRVCVARNTDALCLSSFLSKGCSVILFGSLSFFTAERCHQRKQTTVTSKRVAKQLQTIPKGSPSPTTQSKAMWFRMHRWVVSVIFAVLKAVVS